MRFSLSYGGTGRVSYGANRDYFLMIFFENLNIDACYALARFSRDRRLGVSAPTTCSAFLLPTLAWGVVLCCRKEQEFSMSKNIQNSYPRSLPLATHPYTSVGSTRPHPQMRKNNIFYKKYGGGGGCL
jgi:hypothetical protein